MSLLIQVLAFEQILKRARTKRSAEMQILIGGIGIATIPLAIAQHETKSNPFGFSQSTFDVNVWQVGDVRITNIAVITIVVGIALWAATALWFRRSKHGLALRSIGVDSEVASLMGINRRQLALVTMAVSGGMAGLAGVLFTYTLGAITPESGDILLIKAFAIVILGGVGSMAGGRLRRLRPRGRRDLGPGEHQRLVDRRGRLRTHLPGSARPAVRRVRPQGGSTGMSTWYYANLVLVQATLTGLLMALSVQVPLRMGVFSFAGVGSYGIGAYAAALLVIHLELGSLAAIGLAVVS